MYTPHTIFAYSTLLEQYIQTYFVNLSILFNNNTIIIIIIINLWHDIVAFTKYEELKSGIFLHENGQKICRANNTAKRRAAECNIATVCKKLIHITNCLVKFCGYDAFRCRVPLCTVFTLSPDVPPVAIKPPKRPAVVKPPITNISIDDKIATAVLARGSGRSPM